MFGQLNVFDLYNNNLVTGAIAPKLREFLLSVLPSQRPGKEDCDDTGRVPKS